MHKDTGLPSVFRRVAVSLLIGVMVALAGIIVEFWIDRSHVVAMSFLDNALVGIITALIVFAYEQRQHNAMLVKLNVIAAMNHHVRNALQIISYAPHADQAQQIKIIDDSVNRIQWALQEVLPEESRTKDLFASPQTADQGMTRE